MTIQITRPEVEALINQRLQSGAFKDLKMSSFRRSSLPRQRRHYLTRHPRRTLPNSLRRCGASIWISAATHLPDDG